MEAAGVAAAAAVVAMAGVATLVAAAAHAVFKHNPNKK